MDYTQNCSVSRIIWDILIDYDWLQVISNNVNLINYIIGTIAKR